MMHSRPSAATFVALALLALGCSSTSELRSAEASAARGIVSESASTADLPRIGTITIVTEDVYTADEAARGSAYTLANSLHVRTRESVIHKFLLFREGDPLVASRLAESERNLRALPFIQSATVTAGEPHDGVVDISVVTQDSWSTEPGGSFGSDGGSSSLGFEVRERNFLGLGKELSILYDSTPDRSGKGFHYEDPAAFGRYWKSEVSFIDNTDGRQTSFLVNRPFFSSSQPWALHAFVDDRTMESRIYSNAAITSEFSQAHRMLSFGYGRALRADDDRAHRLTVGLEFSQDEFAPLAGGGTRLLPENREFRYLVAEYEYAQNRFQKLNFIDRDLRYQDFRVGRQFKLRAGISPEAFGAPYTSGLLGASVAQGFGLSEDSLILCKASLDTRVGAAKRNEILGLDVRLIHRGGETHPRVFVGRVNAQFGNDLDSDLQFFADGESGLRGYRLHAFSGDSSFHVNLEERFFLGRELWQIISPGFAVFVDAGNAASGSDVFDPGKLHYDAGIGLRIGAARSPKNILRLDFAYAFDEDPLGRSGWLISFSGSQAF